jgi:alpha-tubulin suppressor-like RCC1 family protein
VSTAESHCHAIKTDGTLWGWGNNSDYGKVGNGSTVDLSSPVQIGALTDWSKISAGWNSTTALKTGGTIWAWGRNIVLGDGTSTTRSSPVQIGALTDWDAVFNGGQNAGGLKTE